MLRAAYMPEDAFQSTPPRGRRPAKSASVADACGGFNPRLRVGGDVRTGRTPPRGSGFNPRLRVGGDRIQPQQPWPGRVSIHASAWEATYEEKTISRVPVNVSIHASAWEATQRGAPNPKPQGVSIHASAWEAMRYKRGLIVPRRFQSTPPRGRRDLLLVPRSGSRGSFNPRLRVGGDGPASCQVLDKRVSIHASAWEATSDKSAYDCCLLVSIHASAWEATWQASACAHKGFAGAISGICRLALPGFPYFL